jgi:hypothetical protein
MVLIFKNGIYASIVAATIIAVPFDALAAQQKQKAVSADAAAKCRALKDRLQCEACMRKLYPKTKPGGVTPQWGTGLGCGI